MIAELASAPATPLTDDTAPAGVAWLLSAANTAAAATLAGVLALGAARLCRSASVPLRYGLLLAGLVLAALSPVAAWAVGQARTALFTVELPAPVPTEVPTPAAPPDPVALEVAAPGSLSANPAGEETSPATPPAVLAGVLLAAVWVTGTLAGLAGLAGSLLRLRNFRRTLRPEGEGRFRRAATRAAGLLGIPVPGLFTSPSAPAPLVVGVVRPAIVLPDGLAEALDDDALDAVLLHETAHVAHGDTRVALLQQVAAAALWWCVPLHVLNRRMAGLREDICDNYVVRAQGDGFRLAEVLVTLAERARRVAVPLPAGALSILRSADKAGGLEQRVVRLLQGDVDTMTRMNATALTATALFGLLAGGVMMTAAVRAAEPFPPPPDVEASAAVPEAPPAETPRVPAPPPADVGPAAKDPPAAPLRRPMDEVAVRVLSGGPKGEEDLVPPIEDWTAKAVAGMGSPRTSVNTDWVPLDKDMIRTVFNSMMGGRVVCAGFDREDGRVKVRIEGRQIGKSLRFVTLSDKDGEGTVVKLTDYPGERNVYLAIRIGNGPADPPQPPKPADPKSPRLPADPKAPLIPADPAKAPPATPKNTDPERFREAPVVLRVRHKTSGPAEKYGWDTVEVLAVLKNAEGRPFGPEMDIAHRNNQGGLEPGECTVYLERYNAAANTYWKLLGGGAERGVSHHVPPAGAASKPAKVEPAPAPKPAETKAGDPAAPAPKSAETKAGGSALIPADPVAEPPPVAQVADPVRVGQVSVTLRVRFVGTGKMGGVVYDKAEVLSVIKDAERNTPVVPGTMVSITHDGKGLRPGSCTVYLDRINPGDSTHFKLLGGDADKGVSHHVNPPKSVVPAGADPSRPAADPGKPAPGTDAGPRPIAAGGPVPKPEVRPVPVLPALPVVPAADAAGDSELQAVRLEARRAELEETRARLGAAMKTLDRLTRLKAAAQVSEAELDAARLEVEVLTARARGTEARLREGELLLQRARAEAERRATAAAEAARREVGREDGEIVAKAAAEFGEALAKSRLPIPVDPAVAPVPAKDPAGFIEPGEVVVTITVPADEKDVVVLETRVTDKSRKQVLAMPRIAAVSGKPATLTLGGPEAANLILELKATKVSAEVVNLSWRISVATPKGIREWSDSDVAVKPGVPTRLSVEPAGK